MTTFDITIRSQADLEEAVEDLGFVPLFKNSVPGFSVEERVAPGLWFTDKPGPWEWKGPVIRETGCAYGKFFQHKAVFISRKWFPDFANYRRDGYDFDARYDEGLARWREKQLFDLLDASAPVLTGALKARGDYGPEGKKGFDTLIASLQAQCYVVISDFVYMQDKKGKPYGWGVAEYSTPEKSMGSAFTEAVYRREPAESYARVLEQLRRILPGVEENALKKLLR